MRRKKSPPNLNQIAIAVEQLERGQLAEVKVPVQIKRLISALPSDEAWELPDRDPAVEVAVHNGLVVAGRKLPVAQSMLVETLQTDPRVRRQLAAVLAEISLGDPKLEDLLFDLGSHEVPAVRLAVIEALGQTDAEPVVAAERLIRLLNRVLNFPDTHDRLVDQIVWHAMESPAVNRVNLVPLCRRLLDDREEGVRCGALLALWQLGPVASVVFDAVRLAYLNDPSEVNRTLAAKALTAIDQPRAREEATQLVADAHARGDDAMRFQALIREAYAISQTVAQ